MLIFHLLTLSFYGLLLCIPSCTCDIPKTFSYGIGNNVEETISFGYDFFYISAFFSNLLCRFHTNASHMHRKNGCGRISSAGGKQSLQHTFMRSNIFKHYQCINDISKLTWVKVLVYPEIHRFSGILPRIFLCVWVRCYAKCSYSTIKVFDGTKCR